MELYAGREFSFFLKKCYDASKSIRCPPDRSDRARPCSEAKSAPIT